ncbi:hypothetical protein [Tabrizicola sp.]|uniref:hypothetical protein n=1 Tax=Tabrizicola sp. TaxID=2005166 RepID=UPI003F3F31A3
MAKKKPLLEEMRGNPRGDWGIRDIERLCAELGMECQPPRAGSHYKVISEHLADILTIPAHRPIKPVYVRLLVSYSDAHVIAAGKREQNGK